MIFNIERLEDNNSFDPDHAQNSFVRTMYVRIFSLPWAPPDHSTSSTDVMLHVLAWRIECLVSRGSHVIAWHRCVVGDKCLVWASSGRAIKRMATRQQQPPPEMKAI